MCVSRPMFNSCSLWAESTVGKNGRRFVGGEGGEGLETLRRVGGVG